MNHLPPVQKNRLKQHELRQQPRETTKLSMSSKQSESRQQRRKILLIISCSIVFILLTLNQVAKVSSKSIQDIDIASPNKVINKKNKNNKDEDENEHSNDNITDDDDHYIPTPIIEPCEFQKPYTSAPIPVILISLGRSGSSVTWDTLSTMLGSTTKAFEITGGNREKAVAFFHNITIGAATETGTGISTATNTSTSTIGANTTNNTWDSTSENKSKSALSQEDRANWPVEKLCEIQRHNIKTIDNPIITGFQWKPYRATLKHPLGQGGLQAIAKYNQPNIKVIFLRRNPLDRLISNLRHKGFVRSDEVPAHCPIDDTDCIRRHKEHSKGTVLPTGKELRQSMKSGFQIDKLTNDALASNGVDYISVSYENLYNNDGHNDSGNVTEWIRIFDFLGRAPKNVLNYREDLTRKDVEDAFAMAPTSAKRHEDIIANYDQVYKDLTKAGMGFLLH